MGLLGKWLIKCCAYACYSVKKLMTIVYYKSYLDSFQNSYMLLTADVHFLLIISPLMNENDRHQSNDGVGLSINDGNVCHRLGRTTATIG